MHSEYVILTAFPLQQGLCERVSVLRPTFLDCLITFPLLPATRASHLPINCPQYNDVNNQQDATTFRLLIFLIQPYMVRATNSPILRSTFWLYIQFLVQCTGRQQCRCIVQKAVYTAKKCSWEWANLSPETCNADLKRLINEKVVASCWLFTSLY